MRTRLLVMASTIVSVLVAACAAGPSPDVAATVLAAMDATQAARPTETASAVPPTATPYPTYTPLPTHTPYPTPTPDPTDNPTPIATPDPTDSPTPTPTTKPTLTPTTEATPQTATKLPRSGGLVLLSPIDVACDEKYDKEDARADDCMSCWSYPMPLPEGWSFELRVGPLWMYDYYSLRTRDLCLSNDDCWPVFQHDPGRDQYWEVLVLDGNDEVVEQARFQPCAQ